MADKTPSLNPFDAAISGVQAENDAALGASGTKGENPKLAARSRIEGFATERRVPVNVLMALGEVAKVRNEDELVNVADRASLELAPLLAQGQSIEDVIGGILGGDEAARKQFFARANEIAEAMYPAEAQARRDAQPGFVGNAARAAGAGILSGVGAMVDGVGVLGDMAMGAKTPTALARGAKAAGDWIKGGGEALRAGMSDEGRKALEDSTPTGDIFAPSTIGFGANPSLEGYTYLALDVLGNLATSIIPGGLAGKGAQVAGMGVRAAERAAVAAGAGAGALGGAGAAADTARQEITAASQEVMEDGRSRLEHESAFYREALAAGYAPEDALERTVQKGVQISALFAAPLEAFGDAATQKLISRGLDLAKGGGSMRRAVTHGALSALEEGAQEVASGVATRYGIQAGTGLQQNLTDGTFGDFLLGAIGGGVVGGFSGALPRREGEPDRQRQPETDPRLLLPSPTGGGTIFQGGPEPEPAAPAPLALPAPNNGGTIISGGPVSNPADPTSRERQPGDFRRTDPDTLAQQPAEFTPQGAPAAPPAADMPAQPAPAERPRTLKGAAGTAEAFHPSAMVGTTVTVFDEAGNETLAVVTKDTAMGLTVVPKAGKAAKPMEIARVDIDAGKVTVMGGDQTAKGKADQEKVAKAAKADPETAPKLADAQSLRDQLAFIQDQGRTNGWDRRLIEARTAVQAKLDLLEPPTKAITAKSGKPFRSENTARTALVNTGRNPADFDIIASDGGFVAVPRGAKPPAQQGSFFDRPAAAPAPAVTPQQDSASGLSTQADEPPADIPPPLSAGGEDAPASEPAPEAETPPRPAPETKPRELSDKERAALASRPRGKTYRLDQNLTDKQKATIAKHRGSETVDRVVAQLDEVARRAEAQLREKGHDIDAFDAEGRDAAGRHDQDAVMIREAETLAGMLADQMAEEKTGDLAYPEWDEETGEFDNDGSPMGEALQWLEIAEGMGIGVDTITADAPFRDGYHPDRDATPMEEARLFPAVKPKEIANLDLEADKAGFIAQTDADARLAFWKDVAAEIGKSGKNRDKLVISLFDYTGKWSQPWEDAGYNVVRHDIKTGSDLLTDAWITDMIEEARQTGFEVVGVLAATPCTTFSGAGARWWKTVHDLEDKASLAKTFGDKALSSGAKSAVEYNVMLVDATREAVRVANPSRFHVIENPIGRIQEKANLPNPRARFHPNNYGTPYTKRTQLFGDFDTGLPTANVFPVDGSKMQSKFRGDDPLGKEARSTTPEGFAYAFFMANDPDAKARISDQPAAEVMTKDEAKAAAEGAIEGEAAEVATGTVAQAAAEAAPEPTDAQKEAGNYQMGHARWNGLELSIETAKGTERRGTGPDGKAWSVTMPADYGYFRGTEGADGDHVDFYMGEVESSDYVMIVNQVDPETGAFDEHKVILGTTARGAALDLYRAGFSDGRGNDRLGSFSEVDVATLKNWLASKDKKPTTPLEMPFANLKVKNTRTGAEEEFSYLGPLRPGYERTVVNGSPTTTQTRMTDDGFLVKRTPTQTSIIDPKGRIISAAPFDVTEDKVDAVITAARVPENAMKIEAQAKPERPADLPKSSEPAKPAAPVEPSSTPPARQSLSSLSKKDQDRAALLRARIADRLKNQTNSGIDPAILQDAVELAGLYIKDGFRKFRALLDQVATDMELTPKQAEPWVRAAYNQARDDMDIDGQDVADMDTAAAVVAEVKKLRAEADTPVAQEVEQAQDEAKGEQFAVEENTDEPHPDQGLDLGQLAEPEPGRQDDGGGDRAESREADPVPEGQPGDLDAGGVERDSPAGSGDAAAEPGERAGVSPGNFVIAPDFALGEGTAGTKIDANIAAIRLALDLERENRFATAEEQATLARYVGWGGLKSVFDPKKTGSTDQYGRAQATLKELLTPAQYRAAAGSTADAHYTSRAVVGAMWDAMRRMGFSGGRALEPTIGSGNFLGLQPADMAARTEWFATELDHITGIIAKHLYPDATILAATGFQKAAFQAGAFDVAIGNPPFGSDLITSDLTPELPALSVHNYIIAKTGLHLRPGGIMGMVVTNRFLDTPNPQARKFLAERFRFVGAVRLPNTAFKANAGTEVTTDIVWFQKLREGEDAGDQSWLETGVPVGDVRVNGYFAAHPEMMLGRPGMDGTMRARGRGEEFTLHDDGRDLAASLSEALAKLDARLPDRETQLVDALAAEKAASDLAIGEAKLLDNGKMMVRRDDGPEGAVLEEVSASTLWGPDAIEWNAVVETVEAAAADFTDQAKLDAARDAMLVSGAFTEDGKPRAKPSIGGAAIQTLMAALSKRTPYLGTAERKALDDLKAAIDKKRLGKKLPALRDLLGLRRDTAALLAAEAADMVTIEAKREKLRNDYRAFVKKHGFLGSAANDKLVNGVPGIEAGLESRYKPANKLRGTKERADEAAILSQRIISPRPAIGAVKSAADGVHISLRDRGTLDIPFIAEITGMDSEKVLEELTSGEHPRAFFDPAVNRFVIADEYLSGDLAERIAQAKKAGRHENVKHLEAAMPAPKTKEQITPALRSMWIPPEVFRDWIQAMGYQNPSVYMDAKSGVFTADAMGEANDFGRGFQTTRVSALKVMQHAVRGKAIVVMDQIERGKTVKNEQATQEANAAAARMAEEFAKWAFLSTEREALVVDAFNEKMNVVVPRKHDGVRYLTQVGNNPAIQLRNSQKNGAWRMMLEKSTLLHHVVGAGKTFTAITAIMERKRLGLSRKSLVAVPNHLIGQWARDFYALYPGAKILAATEKDFEKKNRRKLIARLATGDYDAIIVGHSSLRYVQNSEEHTRKLMEEQLVDLYESLENAKRDGSSGRTASQIAKRIDKYQEKMEKLLAQMQADSLGVDFTQTGIDNLVIDESQEFKNLEYSTAADRLVGMNSPDGSLRALDLYLKVRSLKERDGSVGFLTGTPVSNSLVEVYTVMKYLAHEILQQRGLMHYDAWASAFVQSKVRFEMTAAQKLKERNVLAGLVNLGPLAQIYRSFADVIMRPEVEAMYREQMEEENRRNGTNLSTRFPTPKVANGGRQLVSIPVSPEQEEFTDYLVSRMNAIKANAKDKDYPKIDNALWVLSDARKASIDMRAIAPELARQNPSKVTTAGDRVLAIYRANMERKGTQMVFADTSVPVKTASASLKKLLVTAWQKAGMSEKDAKAWVKAQEGRSWLSQWERVAEALEDRRDSGELTTAKQEALEEWLDSGEADQGAAMAAAADSGFSFYDDLRTYLGEHGVPESEVAFIHDFDTPAKKAELFDAVNAGDVRVLIGSTFKMGAGTNAQERLVALHHIDAPWRPSDMEQREGRIIRQGNRFYAEDPDGFEVDILAYTTEKTSDTVLWTVLERKAAGIEGFLNATADSLIEEENSDADSYANFMAQSTGNPVFLQKMETEKAVRDLRAAQSSQRMIVGEAKSFLREYEGRMERDRAVVAAIDTLPAEAGATYWSDFRARQDAYVMARNRHEDEVKAIREANKDLARKDRQKLPEFELSPPEIIPAGAKLDPWGAKVVAAIEKMGDKDTVELEAAPGVLIEVSTELAADGETLIAEAHIRYGRFAEEMGEASAKKLLSSRKLMSILSMENILDMARIEKRRRVAAMQRREGEKPAQEERASKEIDTKELSRLDRRLQMLTGRTRVAEVEAALARAGRSNRFIDRDYKRPLKKEGDDDKPFRPEGGGDWVLTNAGSTWVAPFGVTTGGRDENSDGHRRDSYWLEAEDDEDGRAIVRAVKTGEKGETLEVVDVYPYVEAGRESRMLGEDPVPGTLTSGQISAIATAAQEALDAMVAGGTVRVVPGKGKIAGRYRAGVVELMAEASGNWRQTLDHEAIHLLRDPEKWGADYGLFHQDEWRALVKAARADARIAEEVRARYPDLSGTQQTEEMVAELFRQWAANRRANSEGIIGAVSTALEKIRTLFRAIGSALRGEGLIDAGEVMEAIASGEIGGRGPDGGGRSSTTRESRFTAAKDAATGAVRERTTKEAVRGFLTDAMGGQTNLLALVPGRALYSELGAKMGSALKYLRLKEEMDALRNDWHAKMNDTAQAWRKITGKNSAANGDMMDLMHRATIAGTDPSEPFKKKALDARAIRHMSAEMRERNAQWQAEDVKREAAWHELKREFDRLPPEFQDMFRKVRDDHKQMGEEFEKAILENARKAMEISLARAEQAHERTLREIAEDGLTGEEAEAALAEAERKLRAARQANRSNQGRTVGALRAEFETQKVDAPYFPLMRHGRYFVTARDENGKVVSFSKFTKERDQAKEAKALEAEGYKVDTGIIDDSFAARREVDPTFTTDVVTMLQDAGASREVLDSVWQRWLETLPDLSVRRSRLHRKGTKGYDEDAFKAFGRQTFHGAHQLARLKFAMEMGLALDDAEMEAKKTADANRNSLIVAEMRKRHDFVMNPTGSAIAQMATSTAFVYYLGMTPAAAALNLSQTAIVGIPTLAAGFRKGGMGRASRELVRASRDFLGGRGHTEKSKNLTDKERAALEEAYRRGTIDKSQAHDLAGVGETGVEYSATRHRVMSVLSYMFHHTERANREVTFLAAYRMGVDEGMTHQEAIDKAADLTWRTHFDYSNTSRSRIVQNDWMKVLLVFRNFQINMLWRLFRDTHQAFKGDTPEARREARIQLGGITMMMTAMAGITGTWGYALAVGFMAALSGMEDDEVEEELKRGLVELFGPWIAGVLLKGVPGHLTGTDLTNRIGMPELWFRSSDRDLEGDDAYNYWVSELLGAVPAIAENGFRGIQYIADGKVDRGIETIAPKFIRDMMRAGRFGTEGVTTLKGDQLFDGAQIEMAVIQALGFTPAALAERYEANSRMKNAEQRILTERRDILSDARADIRDNRRVGAGVLDAIAEFNRENPEYPITGATIRNSMASAGRAADQTEGGVRLNQRLDRTIRGSQAPLIYG